MRLLRYIGSAVFALLLIGSLIAYFALRASLPQLDGEVVAVQLAAAATIERDAAGMPTIRASTRRDLAFATGFAHAQDRFFQMDLLRRAAAGELSQLLGAGLVETDKRLRIHGFRGVAVQIVANLPPADRALLDAYAAGVNAARVAAHARPWEYSLLRADPQTWRTEDSVLAALTFYIELNDSTGQQELARAQLRAALPAALFEFLHPPGTQWDAPIVGDAARGSEIPGPEFVDLRKGNARRAALRAPRAWVAEQETNVVGSNSWAVAGSHTANGAALLANDMHLNLRLPHVWYRARLMVTAGEERRDLVGVTLPGLPALLAGSNGKVAWGYTNSYGDWTDLVIVETFAGDAERYATPQGSEAFATRSETILVRDAPAVDLQVKSTRWGPIVNRDASGRPLALAWTAHRIEATNLGVMALERAGNLEEALAAANRAGGPVQNFVAVDAQGRIGWSLLGQVPVRANYDSTEPASWRAADVGWIRWRAPEEYPRVVDPPGGRLWTANARTLDVQAWREFFGGGAYDLGARAIQIRDALQGLERPAAADMARMQLDDRALFLTRWRDLLLELLEQDAHTSPLRSQARDFVARWSAHAAIDDVGYRIVRAFRTQARTDVFNALTAPARVEFPTTTFAPSTQFEAPLWQLVSRRPQHLLDPKYRNWEEALLGSLDATLAALVKTCSALERCTWGSANELAMRHPLSTALPFASRWLDMPTQELPGDAEMPRVQGRSFGASQRLVVSPGKEVEGILQMPGGPTDHPLAPFYGAGHEQWAKGEPTPLLPGETKYRLQLAPVK
jgi:penicillin G amidase